MGFHKIYEFEVKKNSDMLSFQRGIAFVKVILMHCICFNTSNLISYSNIYIRRD